MIRFVDIRNQDIGDRFAFYDTVTETFVDFSGVQTWNTWGELKDWIYIDETPLASPEYVQRLKSVCPDWVFEELECER